MSRADWPAPAREAYNAGRRKANMPPAEWRRILDLNNATRNKNSNKTIWYRKADLKRYYDITPEGWDAMFKAQGYCCACCGSTEPGRKTGHWSTDHIHGTKIVRGILCNGCNTAAGHLKDEPERCRLLAKYLERGGPPNARRKT